ncbi:hypothetical protein Unana1_08739 [Umbelopsis nana]
MPPSWDLSRHIQLAVLMLILLCVLAITVRVDFWDDYSSNQIAKDAAEMQQQLSNQQEALRKDEENRRLAKLQDIEERRAVLEPVILANDTELESLFRSYDIAVPYPSKPWNLSDTEYLLSVRGQSDWADLLTQPEERLDFKSLTVQERTYKALFQYLDNLQANGHNIYQDPYKDTWELFHQLERVLYPWLHMRYNSLFDVQKESKGAGMIFCVGNGQFYHAATTIRAIRETFKSNIPIEVFYINEDDLSEVKRQYLETEFSNLKTVDLSEYIDDTWTQFGGWAMKPFAIVASSFSQVILADADVFFFKKPESFLEDAGFKKTGALFFYDRTLFADWDAGRKWMLSFLPTMSSLVRKTRWFTLRSSHEQESGVVVIDKRKSILGLLSTCKMNDKRERDEVTYEHVHGDKETFWVGYEMVQTPYAFVNSYGAVIGGLGDGGEATRVCGNQLHLGVDRRPWWWNGGLLRDKNRWPDRYMMFTHFAEGEDWHFETSCIIEEDRIRELTAQEKALTDSFLLIDAKRKVDQQAMHDGTWKPQTDISHTEEVIDLVNDDE